MCIEILPHSVKDFDDQRITYAAEHLVALFSIYYDLFCPENSKV